MKEGIQIILSSSISHRSQRRFLLGDFSFLLLSRWHLHPRHTARARHACSFAPPRWSTLGPLLFRTAALAAIGPLLPRAAALTAVGAPPPSRTTRWPLSGPLLPRASVGGTSCSCSSALPLLVHHGATPAAGTPPWIHRRWSSSGRKLAAFSQHESTVARWARAPTPAGGEDRS